MKKIWFLLCWFPCVLFAQDKPPSANDILTAAYKKASEEHKNVFVIFHASWCGWCKKMDASINDSTCKKYFEDNYVIIHLTVFENFSNKKKENHGADEILKKINAFDEGIPIWLVYDKDGKLIGDSFIQDGNEKKRNIGCPASKEEVAAFLKVLKNSSALTDTALERIATVFRRNDTKQ